ncbi:MAG: carbohydrate kinase family protein [Pseudomonadota bacterium]
MTERSGIICAGHWIVDLVHEIDTWPDESDLTRIGQQTRGIGGGAANVLAALVKLDTGLPLWPMGAIGDDDYGAFILEQCRALGLPTSQLAVKQGIATAHTHVMSVPGRSRTFFYQGGSNDALGADDFPAGTFRHTNAHLFYLGYLTLLAGLDRIGADGRTEAARVLERAQAAGLLTAVDLVSVQHPQFREIVSAAAPFVDYLIMNEVEASRITAMAVDPNTLTEPATLSEMGREFLGLGVGKAVVIHCADLAVWSGADGTELVSHVEPLPASEIVSHLGAGDAFCAGLLYAVHEGWAPGRALGLAKAVSRVSLKGVTAAESIPPLSAFDIP